MRPWTTLLHAFIFIESTSKLVVLITHLFKTNYSFVCLFVCLGFIVTIENFSLIWRRHHYQWRAAQFDLCSALMAIEQSGFFSVPHLLWHWASVYNGQLRGPVTLTPIAERFAVEMSLPVFYDLGLSRQGFNHPTIHLRAQRSNHLRHRRGSNYS